MNLRVVKTVVGIAVGLGAFAAQSSRADMITYSLDNGNSQISGFSGPYGTVSVNLINPTTATITFNSTVENGNINLFGNVYANVEASSWSVSGIAGSNIGTGFKTPLSFTSVNNPGNVDGRGSFNLEIENQTGDGFSSAENTVSFTLTDKSGTWADAASVLFANGNENFLAAHTFITLNPPNVSNGAIVTGYSGSDTTIPNSHVPDGGSTAILLGSGMLGLGWLRARFSRK